jgi:hypothetical protein
MREPGACGAVALSDRPENPPLSGSVQYRTERPKQGTRPKTHGLEGALDLLRQRPHQRRPDVSQFQQRN